MVFSLFLASSVQMPLYASPITVQNPKESRDAIVETARSYQGKPYVYGGTGETGFDCSGLVYRVFLQALGQPLPRTAAALYRWAEAIVPIDVQKGDLVFFNTTGTISHVGIYIGDGRFIHSASEGPDTGVIISSLDEPYWKARLVGFGRVLSPAEYWGVYLSSAASILMGPTSNPTFLYGLQGTVILSTDVTLGLFTLRPGLGLHGLWNWYNGSIECPLIVSLEFPSRIMIFAGWPAIAGISWKPFRLSITKGPLRGGTLSVIGEASLRSASESYPDADTAHAVILGNLSLGLQYTLGF